MRTAILHTEIDDRDGDKPIERPTENEPAHQSAASYVVRAYNRRTVRPHGVSAAERDRFDAGLHHLKTQYSGQLVWIVAERHDTDERQARQLIRKVKSDFCLLQGRAGIDRVYVEMLEGAGGVHANLIGPLPLPDAKRLRGYAYGEHLHVKRVTDVDGLRNYLLKEATPEAAYGKSFRRRKGSHRLGEGGGDRVRLSDRLDEILVQKGVIERHKRTYAARALPKTETVSEAVSGAPAAIPAPVLRIVATNALVEGERQLSLFGDDKPVSRLADFAHGVLPRAVAHEIEQRRQRLGLSQRQLAAMIGIRQPQYANAIRGHDGLSAWVVSRLRDVLLGGGRLAA